MKSLQLIAQLQLTPHPEGGWYRELWQSRATKEGHPLASHIYYLLEKGEECRWHRLKAEEIWFFHQGAPLILTLGGGDAMPKEDAKLTLGQGCFHSLVPGGIWQKAETVGEYTLVSCVVSPAYCEEDWELF